MRPGRFTSLAAQCFRPFFVARKTFVNAPRAILRFPAFCHHCRVNMRTISHSRGPEVAPAQPRKHLGPPLRMRPIRPITPKLRDSTIPLVAPKPGGGGWILSAVPPLQHSTSPFFLQNRFYPLPQIPANQLLDRIYPHLPASVGRSAKQGESRLIQPNPS